MSRKSATLDHWWWQWTWPHGQRAALERVPAGEIEPLREECYGILREAVQPDGPLLLRQYLTYTVATA